MQHKYHGLQFSPESNETWLHLGILRMLIDFESLHQSLNSFENSPPVWFDNRFHGAFIKFNDTFWKFHRAVYHLARCAESFHKHRDSESLEGIPAQMNATADIPLYLDMILAYLRIQADCIGDVTPHFYSKGGKNVKRNSFRDHLKWFTQTDPLFDTQYSSILNANTSWFFTIAGKRHGEGLRNIAIHKRGIYSIGWNIPDYGEELRLAASLINEQGSAGDDLIRILKSTVAEYFVFLDHFYEYFAGKLHVEYGSGFPSATKERSRYARYGSLEFPSFWVFPTISDKDSNSAKQ